MNELWNTVGCWAWCWVWVRPKGRIRHIIDTIRERRLP